MCVKMTKFSNANLLRKTTSLNHDIYKHVQAREDCMCG